MFAPVPEKLERCRVLYISPIKALAVDVERNLRAPLVGIAQAAKRPARRFTSRRWRCAPETRQPRSGRDFLRQPADILITTPESLYLLLTSNARESLRSIETVVIDEIHALVPTKRGSHLALSIERLERLVRPQAAAHRAFRDAASAGRSRALSRRSRRSTRESDRGASTLRSGTLGRCCGRTRRTRSHEDNAARIRNRRSSAPAYRPVTIIDASEPKRLDLKVEVAVEDMARARRDRSAAERRSIARSDAPFDLERDSSASCWN